MKIQTYGTPGSPCVLLLHGMFDDGGMFAPVAPYLEKDYFVAVPTLDGYDEASSESYPGAEEEVARLAAWLADAGVRELAAAAGSSLGAMLVWKLCQRGGVPVHRLVLDSAPFGWEPSLAVENTAGFWETVEQVKALPPDTPSIFEDGYSAVGPVMRRCCQFVTHDTIRRSCEDCFGVKLPPRLDVPGTVIVASYGDQDPNYQLHGKDLAGRTDLTLDVRPGLGHCGFLLAQPEQFAALLCGK